MFSHVMGGSNDLDRSQRFYDAPFAVIGRGPGRRDDTGQLIHARNRVSFMGSAPVDAAPACHANGGTIGLPEQAQARHASGVVSDGIMVENAPDVRSNAFGQPYRADLRDPGGDKLCAACHIPVTAA